MTHEERITEITRLAIQIQANAPNALTNANAHRIEVLAAEMRDARSDELMALSKIGDALNRLNTTIASVAAPSFAMGAIGKGPA